MKRIKPLPEERKPKEYMENDEMKSLLHSLDKSYLDVTDADIRRRYSKFSPLDAIYYYEIPPCAE